jgi:hypothetical protein
VRKKLHSLKHWYETYERRISVGSLFTGFIIDALTMQRIDALRENLWIALNIMAVAVGIILLNRSQKDNDGFWLPNILQFSFGALLGSFFIFYFRSATIAASWPFLALIFLAMVANELFQKRYAKLAFQLSFFYFSIFSFLIFLVPLAIKRIGPEVFILSGMLSLGVLWLFLLALRKYARERFIESRTGIWSFVAVIFVGLHILYFTNLIPPIPLSLKDSGIYHSVEKSLAGNYIVTDEKRGLTRYLPLPPTIHWQTGEPLYAYTAVFSPGSLNVDIVHDWQYKNSEGKWVTATRIPLYISGGRLNGFRVYSNKFTFTPGDWRVDVKTPRGQIIGRLSFKIAVTDTEPELVANIKD